MAKEPNVIINSNRRTKHFGYKGMEIKSPKRTSPNILVSTAATINAATTIELQKQITLVEFTQSPYTDADLQKMEAAVRRNLAVRTALSVREHFTFGGRSYLTVELFESDKLGLDEAEIADKVKELTKTHLKTLQEIDDEDNRVKLVKNWPTFFWQMWQYGRASMYKIFADEAATTIKTLMPLNSRRMGEVILNKDNNMEFEGVYIDGQPLDKSSMIYGTYGDRQISPHTQHYGYSAIEPIVHIAESHNIATEEDMKEILKSAWLKSILFVINTAGMTATKASTYIQTTIDAIDPGKYIGVNTDVKEAIPLDLDPKYDGIVAMVDSLESKIFKSLQVPQFLVQSEDMANMATANKSAALFLDGPCKNDERLAGDILWDQWYEPILRQKLNLESNEDGTPAKLPFKLVRRWEKPKVEEFMEMAQAVKALVDGKIWDVEEANKHLGTESATQRVMKQIEEDEKKMQAQFEAGLNQPDKMAIQTASLNLQSAKIRKDALGQFSQIISRFSKSSDI